jgi:hypothetical protein
MPMTARIDLVPSPHDRLGPVARAIRWWTGQITGIVGRSASKLMDVDAAGSQKKLPWNLLISLGERDAFAARLMLPRGNAEAHAKAIRLRLNDIAPLAPERLRIAATAVETDKDAGTTYAIAMARRDRLDELEAAVRKKGARNVRFLAPDCDIIELKSPAEDSRLRRQLVRDSVLVVIVLAAAVAAVMAWTARIDAETRMLAEQERSLRRAAVAAEAARREADIAQAFISRGILKRRAGAVLDTLAALNGATPNGAWWTSVRWSPQEIALSVQAGDPTRTIEAISKDARSWVVELGGPISTAAGDQPRAFELKLRPREASAQ